MTPLEIAQQRIEECRRTRSTELDLSNLGLDEIPEIVFKLTWLKKLDVSQEWETRSKGVETIPPNIKQLVNLKEFSCRYNEISDLSPLSKLVSLQSIECWENKIKDLSPLSCLTALQHIECGSNKIRDLSPLSKLPALQSLVCWDNAIRDLSPLKQLTTLKSLTCGDNLIRDLSPLKGLVALQSLNCGYSTISDLSPLGGLKALQSLTCEFNNIKDLSPLSRLTALRSLDCSANRIENLLPIQHLVLSEQLEDLYLYGNPIHDIPLELLGQHAQDSCRENLRVYWQDMAKGSERHQQLKIQLVGNGRVGKTTLAYTLEHNHAPSKPFKSTHGIVIKDIQQTRGNEAEPVTLQLWDFGGQEIYHATHRLFLSDDCLYLLLWAEETEEHPDETRHPISYWLELIHDLGHRSPIILVKNQIDRSNHLLAIPPNLDANMPGASQIQQVVNISAKQYRGLPIMRGAIESVLEELKYRVCIELPSSWLQVQRELEPLKSQKTIPFAHFQQLCTKVGIDHAEWFINYLHKTGILFYQQGAFQDQIILNQDWAIKAAYRVFDPEGSRDMITAMHGRFTGQLARMIWPEVDDTERQIYLGFMRRSGICYEPHHRKNRHDEIPFNERKFIIPALLPKTSSAQNAWHKHPDDWLLEIDYPFLHRSIIERLILRLGETYQSDPWYTGTFCQTEFGNVLLECVYVDATQKNTNTGQLNLHLRSDQNPKQLVQVLRKLIQQISPHRRYREYLSKGNKEQQELPELQETEQIHSQLDPVTPDKTLKLFISYSRTDRDYKLTLEKHMRLIREALKHKANLEIWSDHLMDAGEDVNEQILPELRTADIILLVVSPDFLDPERYSCKVELPIVLERFEQNKTPVIPVIVRTTSWHEKLGHLTVATEENADPLSKWNDPDEFWMSVEKGVRAQIEKLLKAGATDASGI